MIWVFCQCQWWVSKKKVWMGGGWVGWALSNFFWIFGICLTLQSPLVSEWLEGMKYGIALLDWDIRDVNSNYMNVVQSATNSKHNIQYTKLLRCKHTQLTARTKCRYVRKKHFDYSSIHRNTPTAFNQGMMMMMMVTTMMTTMMMHTLTLGLRQSGCQIHRGCILRLWPCFRGRPELGAPAINHTELHKHDC